MKIKITHLQSSSQIISLGEIKVLTDPWLTDGEYYGSWYHYPPFGEENIELLEYDFIYVSHIHPDHLSDETFKRLPHKKPVLIHNYDSKFVKRKLEMLGYQVIECDHAKPFALSDGASITIYAADNCNPKLCGKYMGCGVVEKKFGSTQIDTLALFETDEQCVFNTNDCPYELASKTIIDQNLHNKKIDLLLVGYAGAGPYPQCFEFDSISDKEVEAEAKEKQFLDQAIDYIKLIKPQAFAPFAGTYVLGSRLSNLNKFRGVPSVAQATDILNEQIGEISEGFCLEPLDNYDVGSRTTSKSEQTFNLSWDDYSDLINKKPLAYDDDNWDNSELNDLISSAFARFADKAKEINFESDTTLVIQSDEVTFRLGTNREPEMISYGHDLVEPFVLIKLDHNLLHRLLRGPRFAHWNNAEIGSHLTYLRKPDKFERGLYHCMCFLHQ